MPATRTSPACRGDIANDDWRTAKNASGFARTATLKPTPSNCLGRPDFGQAGERGMAEIAEAQGLIAGGSSALLRRWDRRRTGDDRRRHRSSTSGETPDAGVVHALSPNSCEPGVDRCRRRRGFLSRNHPAEPPF